MEYNGETRLSHYALLSVNCLWAITASTHGDYRYSPSTVVFDYREETIR